MQRGERSLVETTARPSRPGTAPFVVAAVLAALAVVLLVLVLAVIRPQRHDIKVNHGLSRAQLQSVDAAKLQIKNMLTYARATFDTDYARTEAGASGGLLSDLQKEKSTLQQQMTASKFDLQGVVTASAFEEASGTNYLVLVSAQGYKVDDKGTRTLQTRTRFEVTMTRTGGRWLASGLQSVGLI
jgi:hypothetical protein